MCSFGIFDCDFCGESAHSPVSINCTANCHIHDLPTFLCEPCFLEFHFEKEIQVPKDGVLRNQTQIRMSCVRP